MRTGEEVASVDRPRPFVLGANMPWGKWCGHDFGLHPYGWGSERQKWGEIERELRALRSLGVTVVRWWIFAGGVNYPCRTAGPERKARPDGSYLQAIDDHARRVRWPALAVAAPAWTGSERPPPPVAEQEPTDDFEWEWKGGLPALSEEFLADFIALCRVCQSVDLQLIPSLLSFEWFQKAEQQRSGVYSRGRRPLVFGRKQRDVRESVRAFLSVTLAPLLLRTSEVFGSPTRAEGARHPIFAWESINEPDWVTEGGPLLRQHPYHPVRAAEMNTFLAEFRELVLAAGYAHTIGFKQFSPRWLAPALRNALRADRERYWHQGHHYPTGGVGGLLEERVATNRTLPQRSEEFCRCLVGEFATGAGSVATLANWPWGDPEVAASERDLDQYLVGRLRLIVQRGYDGALLWSAKAGGADPRNKWNASTQSQLASFAEELGRVG